MPLTGIRKKALCCLKLLMTRCKGQHVFESALGHEMPASVGHTLSTLKLQSIKIRVETYQESLCSNRKRYADKRSSLLC